MAFKATELALHAIREMREALDQIPRANLRVAEAFGYVERDSIDRPCSVLNEVLAILWRLVGPGKVKKEEEGNKEKGKEEEEE